MGQFQLSAPIILNLLPPFLCSQERCSQIKCHVSKQEKYKGQRVIRSVNAMQSTSWKYQFDSFD